MIFDYLTDDLKGGPFKTRLNQVFLAVNSRGKRIARGPSMRGMTVVRRVGGSTWVRTDAVPTSTSVRLLPFALRYPNAKLVLTQTLKAVHAPTVIHHKRMSAAPRALWVICEASFRMTVMFGQKEMRARKEVRSLSQLSDYSIAHSGWFSLVFRRFIISSSINLIRQFLACLWGLTRFSQNENLPVEGQRFPVVGVKSWGTDRIDGAGR
jgi:hypothetical protein